MFQLPACHDKKIGNSIILWKCVVASSIAKCNTWGSHATLSVYAKTL
jgi:hypothetical protein